MGVKPVPLRDMRSATPPPVASTPRPASSAKRVGVWGGTRRSHGASDSPSPVLAVVPCGPTRNHRLPWRRSGQKRRPLSLDATDKAPFNRRRCAVGAFRARSVACRSGTWQLCRNRRVPHKTAEHSAGACSRPQVTPEDAQQVQHFCLDCYSPHTHPTRIRSMRRTIPLASISPPQVRLHRLCTRHPPFVKCRLRSHAAHHVPLSLTAAARAGAYACRISRRSVTACVAGGRSAGLWLMHFSMKGPSRASGQSPK